MSRFGRVISTTLFTAGLVILLDIVMTLTWSEPISAVDAWLAQRHAANELERLEDDFAARAAEPDTDAAADFSKAASALASQAQAGDAIGRIEIPAIDLGIVLIEGTETEDLQRGPGHYPDTVLPGQHGTVAIAGHRTTYLAPFRHIDQLGPGDLIRIEMPYATFTYRFQSQKIVAPTQVGVVRDVGYDRLVLTACNPLYSATQRIVVIARQIEVDPPGRPEPAGGEADGGETIGAPGLGPAIASAIGLVAIVGAMWLLSGLGASSRGRDERSALG